ncbi:MAG: ATP synthase F1 subunit delta, partial [Ruminococcus sp.]|nr:ATP synthase F1 subunit delta [Ruminococcus sp.]
LRENPHLVKALASPVIPVEKKYNIVDKIFPGDIKNFIKVVCKNGRITEIFDIFLEYKNYSNEVKGIVEANLYYVEKPTEEQQEKLEKFVKKRLSAKEVVLSMTESPQLIGGFVIEAGGHRFDRSVKSKLNALNRKLVRR